MTYEFAAYLKLLLLCGYKDELLAYVDKALAEQATLPDIILDLSAAGANEKQLLSVLNTYLLRAKDTDVDFDGAVFDLVMAFLRKKYDENPDHIAEITDMMHRLAVCSGRHLDEPWHTMYRMQDLFEDSLCIYADEKDFRRKFDAFIRDGTCLSDDPPAKPGDSLYQRIVRKLGNSKGFGL